MRRSKLVYTRRALTLVQLSTVVAVLAFQAGVIIQPGHAAGAGGIRVSRTPFGYLPTAYAYAAKEGRTLLEVRPSGQMEVCRRSDDDGKSWQVLGEPTAIRKLDGESAQSRRTTGLYLDPNNGLLVRFLLDEKVTGGKYYEGRFHRRIFTQISRDRGRTWSPAVQLIQKGSEYDAVHYARDVYYGRTSVTPAGTGFATGPDGTIIFPCYFWPDAEYRNKLPPNVGREYGDWYLQAFCFLGRWREDLSGIDWEAGGYMVVPTAGSPCGSDEPTVVPLNDETLLMVIRAGGMHRDKEHGTHSVPHRAVSTDGGRTWKEIQPLTYADGSTLYSPSAISRLIRSTKNGRLYWIANIIARPNFGQCDPRHPLQIAEVDEKTLGIKKETVTIIADKSPEDPELVRFSNFRIYQQRGTGDFVLTMVKSYSELAKGSPPRPVHQYRIELPAEGE